jgi:hypothetical protein
VTKISGVDGFSPDLAGPLVRTGGPVAPQPENQHEQRELKPECC